MKLPETQLDWLPLLTKILLSLKSYSEKKKNNWRCKLRIQTIWPTMTVHELLGSCMNQNTHDCYWRFIWTTTTILQCMDMYYEQSMAYDT